jgi:8-oxo-dGTP diphosphatase
MIRVVAGIIEDKRSRRLLICQRAYGKAFGGKWEFPGGKMRGGETPWAALRGELREELGIEARVGAEAYRVRHRYASMSEGVEVTFFCVAISFGVPRNFCFERICWVRRQDVARYDFLEADRHLVGRLARGVF